MEQCPIPVIDDLFAALNGADRFGALDLQHAYNQVGLDEDSKKLTIINTHRGLFCSNRLPFGVASAPTIFQRKMETILQGLPGVQACLDDVFVATPSDDDGRRLGTVLQGFREHGVMLRMDKCSIGQLEVTYLGH